MQNQKSALGLDGNITTLIGYLVPIVALILVFIEKDNKFVRFHSLQSILWVAVCIVAVIAIVVVGLIIGVIAGSVSESLGFIVALIFGLVYFGWFIAYIGGLIMGAIKSYGGNMYKLPVVGSMAEKWV
jgi:uncharacterized membrane protein